jgi:hypothetical protein
VIINPFDRSIKQNKKESTLNEFDDVNKQNVQSLQTLAITRSINNENSSSDIIPPPLPPRPINLKSNINRSPINIPKRFQQTLPLPLHNNGILLIPQQTLVSNQRSISSISSNESFSDSFSKNIKSILSFILRIFLAQFSNASGISLQQNGIHSVDDIRNHLITENNFDQTRIEAVLILTQGLTLSKQYEMAKLFLNQVKYEQDQLLN